MNVQPQMVDDWKTSDDRLLYTFTLRSGLPMSAVPGGITDGTEPGYY
jgi:hypothetical protein